MKRGTIREDGKVFARYLKGKEIWITKEQYEGREKTRKEYAKKCTLAYRKMCKDKKSIGDYDFNKNLYFIGISNSGKEIWRSKEFLEKFRRKQNLNKKRYTEKCKNLPKTNLKFGDQHPENPELFVVSKSGNKCFFGTKQKLEAKKEALRIIRLKRFYKAKKIKQIVMDNISVKKKRGEIRPEDNFIFFGYSRVGKEIWYSPQIFNEKRNRENLKRRQKRAKAKEIRMQIHSSQENNCVQIFQNICETISSLNPC